MSVLADLKQSVASTARRRGLAQGKVPREAYQHYFLEDEGLHSRIHLQNFWSTFWPQVREPALAHVEVYGPDGARCGVAHREIPPFGSMFLEIADLLGEVGVALTEGTVAIDLEPPPGVRAQLGDVPNAEQAGLSTAYWMAYYDGAENYMYVHSIDKLGGAIFGASAPVRMMMERSTAPGERWRSWRLLDVDELSELQIVAINHAPTAGRATVGFYAEPGDRALFERELDFAPRQLHRVRISAAELAEAGPGVHARIGVDPLLTPNGKPYVLMRYGDGPLSLHHG